MSNIASALNKRLKKLAEPVCAHYTSELACLIHLHTRKKENQSEGDESS